MDEAVTELLELGAALGFLGDALQGLERAEGASFLVKHIGRRIVENASRIEEAANCLDLTNFAVKEAKTVMEGEEVFQPTN